MDRLTVGVEEAGRLVGLSKHTIRLYAKLGFIRSVRVGRRVLIPIDALEALAKEGVSPDTRDRRRQERRSG